jgi:hypothetical protein
MSKPRKKLDETAAKFIFGDEKVQKSEAEPPAPEPLHKSELLEKLTKQPTERVKPIRVSLDLDPETHKRLTDLAKRLGRRKSEVLRILVDQALNEIE